MRSLSLNGNSEITRSYKIDNLSKFAVAIEFKFIFFFFSSLTSFIFLYETCCHLVVIMFGKDNLIISLPEIWEQSKLYFVNNLVSARPFKSNCQVTMIMYHIYTHGNRSVPKILA